MSYRVHMKTTFSQRFCIQFKAVSQCCRNSKGAIQFPQFSHGCSHIMHLERSIRCEDPPTWPLAFGCLQEIIISARPTLYNSFSKPPATRWPCSSSKCNSANNLHSIGFFNREVIAGRLAQTIVTNSMFQCSFCFAGDGW